MELGWLLSLLGQGLTVIGPIDGDYVDRVDRVVVVVVVGEGDGGFHGKCDVG